MTPALALALKFALLLAELYRRALAATAFATGSQALSTGERSALEQIARQENAHVALLTSMLGSAAPAQPPGTAYDFSGGGTMNPSNGPFINVFTMKAELLKVSQLLEDAAVRANKGQVDVLFADKRALETVLRLHCVDARHAAEIRILRNSAVATTYTPNMAPWITGAAFDAGFTTVAPPASLGTTNTQAELAKLVYGPAASTPGASMGEDNLVHGSVTLLNTPANTEAFDEPLSTAAATAVAALFGAP